MVRLTGYERGVLILTAALLLLLGIGVPVQNRLPVTALAETGLTEAEQEEEQAHDFLLEGERVDVNRADLYDLRCLPGIGERKAEAILAYREEHGPFCTPEDLLKVDGIGEGTLAGLADCITVTP